MGWFSRKRADTQDATPTQVPATSLTPHPPEEEHIAGSLVHQVGPGETPLDDDIESVIAAVRDERLTYLKVEMLRGLAAAVEQADREGVPGVIIEAGTALGGSGIVMARAKSADRTLRVYDVFSMIPPPGERDDDAVHARYRKIADGKSLGLGGDTYYGYQTDLYNQVLESFARHGRQADEHNVELHQGLFEDTLVVDSPVAVAHLDGDWYDSTIVCLERIVPHLPVGGRLIIDDFDFWSGCKAAVEDFFDGRTGFRFERHSRIHIVRIAEQD